MGNLPPVRVELIAEIKEFMARMKEAEHGLGKVGDKANYTRDKMAALGQKMATGVLAGVGGTLVLATKYAMDYQKSIEQIGFQANVSEEELKRLHGAVLETSSATATSAESIATAYLAVEKAGIKGKQADQMVTQAAKLANVAHADLNQTVSAGLVIQQLGLAKGMDTVQMYDALYGAVKNSRLSLDELTGVFQGKAALAMSNYGIKLGEVAGVASVFKKANMDAGAGLAGLNLSLVKLTTVNDKANDKLKSVGLSQKQIAEDLKKPNGLITMFTDLSSHISKSGMPLQQFLNSLVGARGAQGLGFLLSNMKELQARAGTGGVSVGNAFDTWLKNPEGALANFKTVAKNTLIGLGNLLLPTVTQGLNFLNGVMDKFQKDKGWQQAGIGIAAAIGATLATVKLVGLGNSIAASFGAEATLLSGPIGIAIGAAVLAYMLDNQTHSIVNKIINPETRGQGVKDLAGTLWNSIVGFTGSAFTFGMISPDRILQKLPSGFVYHTPKGTPGSIKDPHDPFGFNNLAPGSDPRSRVPRQIKLKVNLG